MLFEFLAFFLCASISHITINLPASNSFLPNFLLLIFWILENKITTFDGLQGKIRIWLIYPRSSPQNMMPRHSRLMMSRKQEGKRRHALVWHCSQQLLTNSLSHRYLILASPHFRSKMLTFYTVISIVDAAIQIVNNQGKHVTNFVFCLLKNGFQK